MTAPSRIWCDYGLLDHADGLCCTCPRPDDVPLRLTVRGQRLVAVLLMALLFGGLLGAFVIGQDLRCQRLLDAGSPLAAQHCPTTPTTQETP